jgi:hypothetical protein
VRLRRTGATLFFFYWTSFIFYFLQPESYGSIGRQTSLISGLSSPETAQASGAIERKGERSRMASVPQDHLGLWKRELSFVRLFLGQFSGCGHSRQKASLF